MASLIHFLCQILGQVDSFLLHNTDWNVICRHFSDNHAVHGNSSSGDSTMGMFDHWQPMVPAKELRHQPVAVKLAGADVVLFRTASGQIGALDEMCPHRRMKLSEGHVVGEKLRCAYHGWTFDCDGQGESPGTPKLSACASTWDAREEHGYIWVKSKQSDPVFPKFDVDGWSFMCTTNHLATAPLELTVDNFCEIEHTPMIHDVFGYDLDRMKEVTVNFETTDDTVKVINHGPPKPMNRFVRMLVGIRKGFIFNDTWTTHFSPVYSVYDHAWHHPEIEWDAKVKWRVYIFFTPVHEMATRVTAFTFAKSRWRIPFEHGLMFTRRFMRRKVTHEIELDVGILSNLASYETGIEGMKLSRFDKVLAMNRERIKRIYRGLDTQKTKLKMA